MILLNDSFYINEYNKSNITEILNTINIIYKDKKESRIPYRLNSKRFYMPCQMLCYLEKSESGLGFTYSIASIFIAFSRFNLGFKNYRSIYSIDTDGELTKNIKTILDQDYNICAINNWIVNNKVQDIRIFNDKTEELIILKYRKI